VQDAPSKEDFPPPTSKWIFRPPFRVPADKTFQLLSNLPKTFQKPSKPCGGFGGFDYFSYLCTVNSKAGQREATPESSITSLNTPRLQGPEPNAKRERIPTGSSPAYWGKHVTTAWRMVVNHQCRTLSTAFKTWKK
jgi:hypothetical protein